jgi:chromosome partitioning protein
MTAQPEAHMPRGRPNAHVLVLGNQKGGSGKSTLAMHLIANLQYEGLRVASVDLDAVQGTLSRYVENRLAYKAAHNSDMQCPTHRAILPSDMENDQDKQRDEQNRLHKALIGLGLEHDVIVIDTPGADSYLNRLGHSYADTLITPLNDSFVDLDVLARVDHASRKFSQMSNYAEMVWKGRQMRAMRQQPPMKWIVVRNRLSHLDAKNKREMEILLEALAKRLHFSVCQGIGERVIYRELFLQGITLLDLKQEGISMSMSHVAARQELRQLIDEIERVNAV